MKEKRPVPYPLRIDPGLRKHLAHIAIENDRSLHSEILRRLRLSVERDRNEKPQEVAAS